MTELFKYFPPERRDPITNGTLRFTQIKFFNDPFEGLPKLDFQERPDLEDSFSPTALEFRDSFAALLGVCCFSKDAENILMWSHYAKDHQGYVLGFHENHRWFLRSKGELFRKMSYEPERFSMQVGAPLGFDGLFIKSSDWAYEKEVRLAAPLIGLEEVSKDVFVDRFPRSLIASVTFGIQASKELKNDLINQLKGSDQINFFQAKYSPTKYAVVRERF